jgi:Tfp pilus assembly protein PilF
MKKSILVTMIILAFWGCKKDVNTMRGAIKPGTPEYTMNQGLYFLNEGNINEAEKKLLAALAKKPTLEGALNGLGLVYMYKRDFPKSINYFKRLMRLNPALADTYNNLGLIYTELDKYDLAKDFLLKAANSREYRTPENAYVNLAMLEIKHNKIESAKRYTDKAMGKNKNFAPTYNLKGIIADRENNPQEALAYYKKALSLLTEDDVNILINIGQVYLKMGDKSKALDMMEKALSKAKNDSMKDYIRTLIKQTE